MSINQISNTTMAVPASSGLYARLFKRPLDVVAAATALIALAPLLVLISMGIWLLDGRPIFFRQQRIGVDRKPFRIWKFRTMSDHSGSEIKPDQGSFSVGDNSRVTVLGDALRSWKLDELPQLINVLAGDMSLVGPRPEVQQWTKIYSDKWAIVLSARPGITDPASIRFRDESSLLRASTNPERMYKQEVLPKKLDLNIGYVRNIRWSRDLSIIVETLGNTLFSKKSYQTTRGRK